MSRYGSGQIRVGREFQRLISDLKQDMARQGLKVSDAQASEMLAKKYKDLKCGIKKDEKNFRL